MRKQREHSKEANTGLRILGALAMVTGLVIAPNFFYDPINLPKAFLLMITAIIISALWLFKPKEFFLNGLGMQKSFVLIVSFYFVALLVPLITVNDLSMVRQISGDFGRLNGFATSFALVLVMLFSISVSRRGNQLQVFFYWFKLAGYITFLYSVIQILELDPLSWSGDGTFGFLGNLNFNSAFLGMFSIYCVWKFAQDLEFSKKLWWFTLITINLFIIYESGSLQGLLVFAVGFISMLQLFLPSGETNIKSRLKLRLGLQYFSTFLIILGLTGTVGVGPLGFLTQQTMLFRLDYWLAGIRMFLSHPLTGVGLDGYGRYYREYRDETAAFRTNPERITNVSHNVFIDQFASGGLLLGLSFFSIFAYSLFKAHQAVRISNSFSSGASVISQNSLLVRAILLGYSFQLLVSINQIGLAIWGWAFLGIAIGNCLRVKAESNGLTKKTEDPQRLDQRLISKFSTVIIATLTASLFWVISNYVKTDLDFRAAFQMKDYRTMWSITKESKFSSTLSEVALKFAGDAGDYEFLEEASVNLLASDNRNYFAWLAQIALPNRSPERRLEAVLKLGELDPFNPEAKAILEAIQEQEMGD